MSDTTAQAQEAISVRELSPGDTDGCVALWNACCDGPCGLVYKKLTPGDFLRLFVESPPEVAKVNLVAVAGNVVVGFANGAVRAGGPQGYITAILVRDGFRRRGIGSMLLSRLEELLVCSARSLSAPAGEQIDRFELMFFNPVTLTWIIPGTGGHDHPNSPGVDVACEGYLFFKNRGYRDIAYQNSYYLRLSDYRYPEGIQERIDSLASEGIRITRYDPRRHHGLQELFDNLGNEEWREIITANLREGGPGDPVLVITSGERVCGFTGPIRIQESGRGYFAGIGVHSDFRGRGAGKVLFAALCMELKERGGIFMSLFTGENNPARNIYEAAGFKIVRTWADMRKQR